MHSFINLFLFSSLYILSFPKNVRPLPLSSSSSPSPSEGKLFDLDSLPHGYLTFLGDSRLGSDSIALTKGTPRSAGMVFYSRPILFLDPHSKTVPSFSTMFSFSIENENTVYDNKEASGDGLAFLISSDNDSLGSPGYLGLVDSTNLTRNNFIAIEFDTRCDRMFQDPDDNHLGLDINNLFSVQLATSSSLGVNLKSGDVVNTWIDYKGDGKRLEVFLSGSKLKPEKPLLKVDIDLFDYLKENVFVGFSAATDGSMQLTRIEEWEFTIVEFSPPSPPPSPSPSESGRTFPNPSESGHKHSHLSRLAIGVTVGVCFIPFVVVSGWFCWNKLMGMIQKSEGSNYLKMQIIMSSQRTSCQEIRVSIPNTNPDEVVRGLVIEKILDNEAELIHGKKVKPSTPVPATVSL